MRIIYTRERFTAMVKADRIKIIKSGKNNPPEPSFWDQLKMLKIKYMAKRA